MKSLKDLKLSATALVVTMLLVGASPSHVAFAQTAPPVAATSVTLTEPVVKALQEALNKQGIAVKVDGALNDDTRAAVKKYQTQHHLPVTGEPDKATLDKLGVRLSAAAGSMPTQISTSPDASTQPGQMAGGAMNCPMMQGQMQAMMQMMQSMQGMMQMMQGQMQPGLMQPGRQMQPGSAQPMPMQPGQMPGGSTAMACPMMQGQMQSMMQMMQGMQGMMQMMQGQMQPGAR
ncbi:MAG: peptidoglycan-binding domain-containing protein [Pseudolabrys sp.]|nr:peptidoglycan-binding domain-containing protein [Pseudolabrys sp.]MDP2295507.1 peptidoglycan-binding domain-containing protein [Pseudolabrys sp.]